MTDGIRHLTTTELEAGLDGVRQSPSDRGTLRLISRRPAIGARERLHEGKLDTVEGLVGDNWSTRGQQQDPPREANIEAQLTLMNSRSADLVAAGDEARWDQAGDQLYVDFDLSEENAPAGTRLSIGEAVVEVTEEPHPGCKKFVERFGMDAMLFVNSDVGRQLHLRGINTKVVQSGTIRVDDPIAKV
jgi:hypothetical protein